MMDMKDLTDEYINGPGYPFSKELKFHSIYTVGGDLTPSPMRPISHKVRNKDVMRLMKDIYPNVPTQELAEEYAEGFFGDWEGAEGYILG